MLVKLLTAIVILLAAALMFAGRRAAIPSRKGASRAPARVPRADDLVKCGRCGIWLPPGQRCDCAGSA